MKDIVIIENTKAEGIGVVEAGAELSVSPVLAAQLVGAGKARYAASYKVLTAPPPKPEAPPAVETRDPEPEQRDGELDPAPPPKPASKKAKPAD